MTNKKLLEDVGKLGVPLLLPDENVDVHKTLADVVKSHDVRLWENFPAALLVGTANFDFKLPKLNAELQTAAHRQAFKDLVTLSKAMYDTYRVPMAKLKNAGDDLLKFMGTLTKPVKATSHALANDLAVSVSNLKLYSSRLKLTFEDFLSRQNEDTQKMRAKHQELSLEFALSQVFSPRQKELFNKKLSGEKFSKTEREYYSRAVKKKVQTLANPDLHRLAQKLLE